MSRILEDAKRRIPKTRRQQVDILIKKDGRPVEGAKVQLRMKNHDFLFGATCYTYGTYPEKEQNDKYSEAFAKLLNYTMIPYHWGWYEPRRHDYNEPYASDLIAWAKKHNIKRKLHALIWHEVCPDWVTYDHDIKALYEERIGHLMENYGNDFNFIDVINETTVNDRFENPVSKWIREYGPVNMMKFGVDLVRSYNTDAKLLYGDWNVHEDEYYDLLGKMREGGVDIDILGIQSHMHKEVWAEEETMRVMDKAGSYGWPLHFPECSICSGRPVGETSYAPGAHLVNKWEEKEEDLYTQAEEARDFYTLVFSHPAVEALSWFDFIDHRWLGAPAGLVNDITLEPKPIYNTLYDMIHKQWHSDDDLVTASNGLCQSSLFFGEYDITVEVDGQRSTVSRHLKRPSFYEDNGQRKLVEIDID